MHVPFYIENLIKDKETTFQDFFNLEKLPDDMKELKKANKLIRDLRYDISDTLKESQNVIRFCDKDYLMDAQNSAIIVDGKVSDMEHQIDELEKIVEQWRYAYDSLLSLTTEIINKEKIDLLEYSANISETELKAYRRITKINKMLGDSK